MSVALAVLILDQGASREAESSPASPVTTISTQTTSTTLPIEDPGFADAVAYEAAVSLIGTRVQRVANRVLEINSAWDERDITQSTASARLALQITEARLIAESIERAASKAGDSTSHLEIEDKARELHDAVTAVRDGLLEPGSRKNRDDAAAWTVLVADEILLAIDEAFIFDRSRTVRTVGSVILWSSVRIGDCVDTDQQGPYTEILSCQQPGRGEVLATPLPLDMVEASPLVCARAATPNIDLDEFLSTDGSWYIRGADVADSAGGAVCTYVPASSRQVLTTIPTPFTGPLVSDQWDALAQLDLAIDTPFEAGQCFTFPPDDNEDFVQYQYLVDCTAEPDFMLLAAYAVSSATDMPIDGRLMYRSWQTCQTSADEFFEDGSYLTSNAFVLPSFPGFFEEDEPLAVMVCVLDIPS